MKEFFKKPLNIISVVAAFLGILGMVLTLCVPGKTYYGETTFTDGTCETRVVLDGKNAQIGYKLNEEEKRFAQEDILNGISDEEFAKLFDGVWFEMEEAVFPYEIKNGDVYLMGDEYPCGKISGFKLKLDLEGEFEFTNKLAVAFFIVSCVFLAAGAAWIVYTIIAENKKKKAN